jgi:hypothetical protein
MMVVKFPLIRLKMFETYGWVVEQWILAVPRLLSVVDDFIHYDVNRGFIHQQHVIFG